MPRLEVLDQPMQAKREIVVFRRVPIARPGLWHLMTGDWELTLAEMREIAESYDPKWLTGTFDTDHDGVFFGGPSYGLISRAWVEGQVLYCDLVNVSPWLAEGIDNGNWPQRSLEVHPFIDQGKPAYLTGLTALGKSLPGIQGLGPWPRSERLQVEDLSADELIDYANHTGEQAAQFRAASFRFIASKDHKEELVADNTQTTETPAGDQGQEPRIAELQQQLEAKEAEARDLESQLAGMRSKDEQDIEERNRVLESRLASAESQIAEYSIEKREREIASLADGLLGNGQLLPAEKETFVALARQVHGRETRKVRLAAGGEQEPQESPFELLVKFAGSLQKRVDLGETPRPGATRPSGPLGVDGQEEDKREQRIASYMEKHGVSRSAAISATAAGLMDGDPPRRDSHQEVTA